MKQIHLKTVPVSADQVRTILEENGILYNHYAEEYFAHPHFSDGCGEELTVVIASLREIGMENGASLDELFRILPERNLKPCPCSTGLFLRLAWHDQPQSRSSVLSGTHSAPDGAVTVLSEIPEKDDAFPKGLYLRNVDGRLWLRGYVCDDSYRFSADDLFAFAQEENMQ